MVSEKRGDGELVSSKSWDQSQVMSGGLIWGWSPS